MNTQTVGGAFYKSLAAIALPVALQNLISFSVNLMDTIMLGSLGEVALSASSLANQVFFIYTVAVFGIASGAIVLCSQYWGKQDVGAICRVTALALRLAAAAGLFTMVFLLAFPRQIMQVFTNEPDVIQAGVDYLRIVCFSYLFYGVTSTFLMVLRSTETVNIAVVIYAVSFVVNVGGNYAFIFGKFGAPRMGVAGAAVGTVLARVAEFLLVLGYMAFFEKKLRFRPRMVALASGGLGRDLFRYGMPVMMNELLWSLAISMHSVVLGHMGSDVVAANSICYIMYQMVTSIIFGVANGSAVLVGKIIGAGDWAYARACVSRLVRVYAVLGVVCAILVFAIGLPMLALYDIQPTTVALAQKLMGVYAFAMFFQAFTCPLISGVLRGGGDTRFAMAVDVGCIWAMVPLGAAAFWLGAPAVIVLFVLKFDMPIKAALCLRRLAGGQWIRSVTR
ncbi:MATE family efflux transporter [uncultured Ruthenibacterium sp.]|uniref:MATE family efflux transporter n=1 Tax=uncultured Ruthenibacterium sp. TaxID=1905347 RepID=UPI00349E9618